MSLNLSLPLYLYPCLVCFWNLLLVKSLPPLLSVSGSLNSWSWATCSVTLTSLVELHDELLQNLCLNSTDSRGRHEVMPWKKIRAAHHLNSLLKVATPHAAANKHIVRFLVWLAVGGNDLVMEFESPLELAIVDTCLNEASEDLDVWLQTILFTELLYDRKRLLEPTGTPEELYESAEREI